MSKARISLKSYVVGLMVGAVLGGAVEGKGRWVWLDEMDVGKMECGWESARANRSFASVARRTPVGGRLIRRFLVASH